MARFIKPTFLRKAACRGSTPYSFALNLPDGLEGAPELVVLVQYLFPREIPRPFRYDGLLVLPEPRIHVRLNAGFADKVPVGGQPLGYAEQDGRAVAKGLLGEHGAGAEGGLPDHRCPIVVAQGAGHYLGARRRPAVGEHDHRRAYGLSVV